jgi:hypothetical protein
MGGDKFVSPQWTKPGRCFQAWWLTQAVSIRKKATPMANAEMAVMPNFLIQLSCILCTCLDVVKGMPDTKTMDQSHM